MSEEKTKSPAPSGSGLDRRKVLRASAWAAPVVLVATATPAAAGSLPEPPGMIRWDGLAAWAPSSGTISGNFQIAIRELAHEGALSGAIAALQVTITVSSGAETRSVVVPANPNTKTSDYTWSISGLPKGEYTVTAVATGTLTSATGHTGQWEPMSEATSTKSGSVKDN